MHHMCLSAVMLYFKLLKYVLYVVLLLYLNFMLKYLLHLVASK